MANHKSQIISGPRPACSRRRWGRGDPRRRRRCPSAGGSRSTAPSPAGRATMTVVAHGREGVERRPGCSRADSNVTWSGSHWWSKRGASTASRPVRPQAVTLSTTSSTVLMIVRQPGDPVTSTSLPFSRHDRRRHRAEHALARRDEVRRRADVAGEVGRARLLVEVAHLVVEQEPGAGDDDVRAVAALRACRCSTPRCRPCRPPRSASSRRLLGGSVLRDDVLAELDAARRLLRVDRLGEVARVRLARSAGRSARRRSPGRRGSARDRDTRGASPRSRGGCAARPSRAAASGCRSTSSMFSISTSATPPELGGGIEMIS